MGLMSMLSYVLFTRTIVSADFDFRGAHRLPVTGV